MNKHIHQECGSVVQANHSQQTHVIPEHASRLVTLNMNAHSTH